MRSPVARLLLPFMMLVLIGACAGYQQKAEAPPVDTAAIRTSVDSLTQAFSAAIAGRDTGAVVSFYSDDARFLPPNSPRVDGRDSIRTQWVGFMSMPGMELKLASRDVIVSQAGDMAVDVGTYTLKWNDAKGKPMEDVGKYVAVFKQVDGGWKIIVDTFNSDRPIPT